MEIRLKGQAVGGIVVDHERLRCGSGIETRAVGASRSDEACVPEQHVVLDGEISGRGDGDGIPKRAGEVITQDCARGADVQKVLIAEPSSRANCNTDPAQELY